MSFDAHEEKIKKIFAGDARFVIPRNQRKYVWGEKQWKELLNDILYIKSMREMNNYEINHFFGTFVLQEVDNKFQIIDGQQRITTLMLILSSLCAVFNEIKDEEEHGKTKQYLIGNIGLKSEYCRMENTSISNIASIIESVSEYRENINTTSLLDVSMIEKRKKGNKEVNKSSKNGQ